MSDATQRLNQLARGASYLLGLAGTLLLLMALGIVLLQRDMTWPVAVLLTALLLSGCALFLALRGAPATRLNLALLLVALGVSVFLANVALELIPRRRPPAAQRNVRDVILEYRQRGVDAMPPLHGWEIRTAGMPGRPALLEHEGRKLLPLVPAPARATTVFCNEGGVVGVYQSDRFGFNNPDDVWSRSELDVIAIGDSFVHGQCMNDEKVMINRLRSNYSVLNLGLSGAGPLMELAILREYAGNLKARNILWFYYEGNDLEDLRTERQSPYLLAYLEPGSQVQLRALHEKTDQQVRTFLNELLTREAPPFFPVGVRAQFLRHSVNIVKFTALRNQLRLPFHFPVPDSTIANFAQVMKAARDLARANQSRIWFVYLPTYDRLATWGTGDDFQGRGQVLEVVKTLGIPVIDVYPPFAGSNNWRALWARPRGHYTAEGYAIAAHTIEQALNQN